MKKCELCKVPARIFCDSDQASLCWDCDAKVHAANFLVARHVRQLLCRMCLSPTPWKASGATLSNAASVCHRCAAGEYVEDSDSSNDDEFDTENEDSDEVTTDNQIVPWSSTPPPPPLSESSSECRNDEEDISVSEPETTTSSLKRQRDEEDAASDRDLRGSHKSWALQRKWCVTDNRRRPRCD